MTPEITLARMTTDHLAQVVKIERSVFRDPWSQAAFVELMSLVDTNWVALQEGTVAGYLVTQWVLDEVHILNVAVGKDRQRRGIGRQLLEFVIRRAQERGMRDMFLEVRVGNTAALALYRAMGFEKLAERKRYYADGEDALIMHLRLAAETTDRADERQQVDRER